MGKDGGFLTPKAIGNRIKSKGLQKLRWYCQMCQKQCRDENGMKCHMKSEGHLRSMRVFADNPNQVLSEFSALFLKGFVDVLSHRHGSKRVLCNKVYQEYIGHKEHIHMNATQWTSLTALCKYLGKEGKCVVDETEKGWFIQYVDKDPQLLARQAAMEQQQRAEVSEEERMRRMIAAQVEAARAGGEGEEQEEQEEEGARDLVRAEGEARLEIKMTTFAKAAGPLRPGAKTSKPVIFQSQNAFSLTPAESAEGSTGSSAASRRSVSNIEALMAEAQKKKESQEIQEDKNNRTDYWLAEGIVVKVLNKKVGEGKFYKAKGVVRRVIDRYVAEVRLEACGTKVRLDQEDLETVLPRVGGRGLLLNGRCRGCEAEVLQINETTFNCDVRVLAGGKELRGVDYEDISKLA